MEFEGRLLGRYGFDNSLQLSKQEFMEWIGSPEKGRNTSVLLQEFEKRFTWLLALDQTVLDTSKVLLFINSVDALDQERVGLLLETDKGLTADLAMVKRVCIRFEKQREWNDAMSSMIGPGTGRKPEVLVPTRIDET